MTTAFPADRLAIDVSNIGVARGIPPGAYAPFDAHVSSSFYGATTLGPFTYTGDEGFTLRVDAKNNRVFTSNDGVLCVTGTATAISRIVIDPSGHAMGVIDPSVASRTPSKAAIMLMPDETTLSVIRRACQLAQEGIPFMRAMNIVAGQSEPGVRSFSNGDDFLRRAVRDERPNPATMPVPTPAVQPSPSARM